MMRWFARKKPSKQELHKCCCCGYYTVSFSGDICPVCFWEADILAGMEDPSDANHGLTLSQARKNYQIFGACEKDCLKFVRKPKPDELSGIDD